MLFSIGEYVSRNSHKNDIIFKIKELVENSVLLEGVEVRLYADSDISDLKKEEYTPDDESFEINNSLLDRDKYFYIPGKVLHIDGDNEYLSRCMKLYKKNDVMAYGVVLKEDMIKEDISKYLKEVKPNILVITGHDGLLSTNQYRNSDNFISAVKEARKIENSKEKLIIIAGACQSNYEELIKAGANFASSPKRVNIHALDPAIIASKIALTEKHKSIDLINIINGTKYKEDGFGGIITNGTMYRGYPR